MCIGRCNFILKLKNINKFVEVRTVFSSLFKEFNCEIMKTILEDIKEKLINRSYKNEEHIRFSLVSRILKSLEWDIWNSEEVNTEFSPRGERGKIDIALFMNQFVPPIYIEIKAADKLSNANELNKAESQLRDYNVDLTALFTILTDGNQWRFYYSQEGGTFSQKCFKVVELLRDDIEDVEYAFISFLRKSEISNGSAKKEAYEYLQMSRKQQIMEESMANAKREQDSDPLLNLVDALCDEVKRKGIIISKNDAIDFLNIDKNKKKRKTVVIESKKSKVSSISTPNQNNGIRDSEVKIYSLSKPYKLNFSKIIKGNIENVEANNWQNLLRLITTVLLNKRVSSDEITRNSPLNVKFGNTDENGFHPIPGTDYSLQNVDANIAGKAILLLAKKYNIKVEIEFVWRNNPKAFFPNGHGKIIN